MGARPNPVGGRDAPLALDLSGTASHGTDHAHVELRAVQYADGSVADFELFVYDPSDNGINSDQARELAAALLEAAAELDGWAGHDRTRSQPAGPTRAQHPQAVAYAAGIRAAVDVIEANGGTRRAADPGRLGPRIHNPGDRGRGDWGRVTRDDILSLARRPAIARGV